MRLSHFALILLAAGGAAAQERDFSQVTVKSVQLGEHLYMLTGAGGNIAAAVAADGVLLVDADFAPVMERILAVLRQLPGGDKPVRFVIDTHYHYDHTGGNLPLAQAGAVVIASDQLRARYAAGGGAGNGGSIHRDMPAGAPAALPLITFDHELSVHWNGEDVRAVYYPNAHTDGDVVVYFPRAHAVHMGDIFVRYGFPLIDIEAGGSVQGMIGACEDALRRAPADAKIIPGHGEPAGVADLRQYLQMLRDTSAAVAAALKAGKTLAQMKAARVLGPWSERYSPPQAFVDTDAFTESLYYSLEKRPTARHGPARRPG